MLPEARVEQRFHARSGRQWLDMAIVNYTKIYPLYKIPQEEVDLARKLIFQDERMEIRCRST